VLGDVQPIWVLFFFLFYILVKGLCSILVEGDGVGERLNGMCGFVGVLVVGAETDVWGKARLAVTE
jgi:hypothetical protein